MLETKGLEFLGFMSNKKDNLLKLSFFYPL